MNGLRVYIKAGSADTINSRSLFYSRRGNGPYYCWLYEENDRKWRVSRVIAPEFTSQTLSVATWKTVPPALQTRLVEHYVE